MAKINLNFYTGQDCYSDGDVEDDILQMVKKSSDFTEILHRDERWAMMYHLSPLRRNLLEWYDFKPEASLLEIGGGCGSLSGLFCEKLKEVTVVELSRRRSEIIYNRHKRFDNLEVIVGNLNDISFKHKYDYITLIGVLEYAGKFTEGTHPYSQFIEKIKGILNPGGKLFIAIENKFGLKYWAGAKEDHTGLLFDSIKNYQNDDLIKTFGKNEMTKILENLGFEHLEYYYPMPDYKLPKIIYSDDYLPDESAFFSVYSPNYDLDRYVLFDESAAYKSLIQNKMFPFFANSFLVVAY